MYISFIFLVEDDDGLFSFESMVFHVMGFQIYCRILKFVYRVIRGFWKLSCFCIFCFLKSFKFRSNERIAKIGGNINLQRQGEAVERRVQSWEDMHRKT